VSGQLDGWRDGDRMDECGSRAGTLAIFGDCSAEQYPPPHSDRLEHALAGLEEREAERGRSEEALQPINVVAPRRLCSQAPAKADET